MHVTFRHLRRSWAAVGRAAVPLNHLFFSCHLSEISEPGRGQRTVTLTEVVRLQTKVREDSAITEKAPTKAFSWLKVPTSAFTALDMKWGGNGQWSKGMGWLA